MIQCNIGYTGMRQRAEMLMDIGFKHSDMQSEAFIHDLKERLQTCST